MGPNQQARQQQTVMIPVAESPVSTTQSGTHMKEVVGVKSTLTLSLLLILAGVLMFAVQTACTLRVRFSFHEGGTGIWCGPLIILSGIFGLIAASKKTNLWVITFLVFNVLVAFLFAPIMMGVTGGELSWDSWDAEYFYNKWERRDLIPMTNFLLLDSVFTFALSIWGIVINATAIKRVKACLCCFYCCCCKDTAAINQTPTIIYLPADQMVPNTTPINQICNLPPYLVSNPMSQMTQPFNSALPAMGVVASAPNFSGTGSSPPPPYKGIN